MYLIFRPLSAQQLSDWTRRQPCACAQACRWEYSLIEKNRPDEGFDIEEDERGTYVMNSKDLCLIDHIPDLIEAGICSLKIEGRMKSIHYVATVVSVYRKAIDAYWNDPKKYQSRMNGVRSWKKFLTGRIRKGLLLANQAVTDRSIRPPVMNRHMILSVSCLHMMLTLNALISNSATM